MSSIYVWLRDVAALDAAEPDVLDAVFAEEFTVGQLRELLGPLVVREYRLMQRSFTRAVEQDVAAGLVSPHPHDRVAARRRLVSEGFFTPGGGWVAWLDATAEDHEARALWQRRQARACVADAELHEVAARQIRVAGVKCLRDIEEVA